MPYTAMHEAAKCGDISAAIVLLRGQSGNINVTDIWDNTPIHYAITNGHAKMVTWLLENGSGASNQLSTSLHCAALYGQQHLCKLFLDIGSDVNATDAFEKKTALHSAFIMGYHREEKSWTADLAEMLIVHGADINSRTVHGDTPLHTAVHYDHRAGALLLVEHGADIHAVNSRKESPFQIAMRQNPALARRMENATRRRQKAHLIALALLLKPLNCPVLVVWEIYLATHGRGKYRLERFPGWKLLADIKKLCSADLYTVVHIVCLAG